jgi:hypothetical protein
MDSPTPIQKTPTNLCKLQLSITSWARNLFCNKVISNPYNPNNHHINANHTPPPPSKFQINKVKNKIKDGVKVTPTHSISIRMMFVKHTSLVTYETTLVHKSRWVLQMCCWFTTKAICSTPELKSNIQCMIMG